MSANKKSASWVFMKLLERGTLFLHLPNIRVKTRLYTRVLQKNKFSLICKCKQVGAVYGKYEVGKKIARSSQKYFHLT